MSIEGLRFVEYELFDEQVETKHHCPGCGSKLIFNIQGQLRKNSFPEISRVLITCKKCKTQTSS